MRLSSHLSSSTFSTGMLAAARVNPSLRRRVASSRPRRCGSETTRGADMTGSSLQRTPHVVPHISEKRDSPQRGTCGNPQELSLFPFVFSRRWQRNSGSCRAGRKCQMSIGLIILIILIIALLGGFSGIGGGPFYGTGYYGGGGLGLIIVILLILLLLGRI